MVWFACIEIVDVAQAKIILVNRMFEELADLMEIKKAEILAEVMIVEKMELLMMEQFDIVCSLPDVQVRRKKESKKSVLEAQRRNIKVLQD